MVDDMKKKMGKFEHLIGFSGSLNVTSRDSMKRLIGALKSRYKHDVQNSIRLHRLEFFYDLVEGRRRRGAKRAEINNVSTEKEKKKLSKEDKEEDQQETISKEGPAAGESDEVLSIRSKDIDDWKNLLTLSKIYYVLEHPRSEGLTWKRRITKKKTIDKFGDIDLIEWRVTQNFRLRGLEEWAQSRSDARKHAEQQKYTDELESDLDEDARELEKLYEILDPSGEKIKRSKQAEKRLKGPSTAERPFKFQDECIEDWTESYSEDSDYSDAEDIVDEIEDLSDEVERKIGEFEETKMLIHDEEESISELFSKYPEFLRYREEIFERMDKAETVEEWYNLYYESCVVPDDSKKDQPLDKIIEEEEEEDADEEPAIKAEEVEVETDKQKEAVEKPEMKIADEEQTEVKEPKMESEKEEETIKQEVTEIIKGETGKETEVETTEQEEAAKVSEMEIADEEILEREGDQVKTEEESKMQTEVKEPEMKSEKEEGTIQQEEEIEPEMKSEKEEGTIQQEEEIEPQTETEQEENLNIPEKGTTKEEDENKGSETKLDEKQTI